MGNETLYYYESIRSSWPVLTGLYLEAIGWEWNMEEMDYTTSDLYVEQLTVEIEDYVENVYFEMNMDEIVREVLTSRNFNDEEALSRGIKEQLSILVDQELPDLGTYIKEEVRQAVLCSKMFYNIKSKADRVIKDTILADRIYYGLLGPGWEGTLGELTDIIRRGLKVTTIRVKNRSRKGSYMDWMVKAVYTAIKKELYNRGYTAEQVELIIKGLGTEVEELVSNRRWAQDYWGIELKILVVPKRLSGFMDEERVRIINEETHSFLKVKGIVQ